MIVFLLMVCALKVGEDNILTRNTILRTMNGKYSYLDDNIINVKNEVTFW